MTDKYTWIWEWSATAFLVACVALSSLNMYPWNIFTGFAGNFGWLVVGIYWKKPSLITISALLALMYVGGIFIFFKGTIVAHFFS